MIEGLKPYTYGYMYPDNTLRFSDREINGMRPLHPVPLYSLEQIDTLQKQLGNAVEVIKAVVHSYPVAAGTSKYGYEEDHDGYGSIRQCRLFLEKLPLPDEK